MANCNKVEKASHDSNSEGKISKFVFKCVMQVCQVKKEKKKMPQQLYNSPNQCASDTLKGIKALFPSVEIDLEALSATLKTDRQGLVGIMTGSGCGHEPFPLGFLAKNMLTGATIGPFLETSSEENIYKTIQQISMLNRGGVLALVLNYEEDQVNFRNAIKKAQMDNINVEQVTIGDEVSSLHSRGLCGIVFLMKIAGQLSAMGCDLDEIKSELEFVCQRIGTTGVRWTPPCPPGEERAFEDDGIEMWCGMRKEPEGHLSHMGMAKSVVPSMMDNIFNNRPLIASGTDFVVLINGLGDLSALEMRIIAFEVSKYIKNKGRFLNRIYAGTFMSSADCRGVQISILNVSSKPHWIKYLDRTTDASGWTCTRMSFVHKENMMDAFPYNNISNYNYKLRVPTLMFTSQASKHIVRASIYMCEMVRKSKIDEEPTGIIGQNFKKLARVLPIAITNCHSMRQLFETVVSTSRPLLDKVYEPFFTYVLSAAAFAISWPDVLVCIANYLRKLSSFAAGPYLDLRKFATMIEILLRVGKYYEIEFVKHSIKCRAFVDGNQRLFSDYQAILECDPRVPVSKAKQCDIGAMVILLCLKGLSIFLNKECPLYPVEVIKEQKVTKKKSAGKQKKSKSSASV